MTGSRISLDEEPEIGELQHKAQQTAQEDPKVDILWYDKQLYGVLSFITTSTALQTVKNLRDHEGVRGCKAWYQITREVAGRSGVRLERLADRVHHPKPMSSYKEAMARLIEWENDCKELAKLEKQPLSDLTKRTTLKAMLPPDLERDSSLKPWSEAWKFVLEQVALRTDWKSDRKFHNNDMDVDFAEEDKGQGEDPVCKACEEGGDLTTMKGGGTAKFQGHCDYCWIWGHKKADCHKLTRDLGKGDGKDGGKGKGKDIGKGKGKDGGKGGWRPKGGYQPKGGWQQKGGGGKNG